MIIQHNQMAVREFGSCHGGVGTLLCRELLADYARTGAGIKFVHDDVLEPGVSIGPHTHSGDEEVYVILEGRGVMTVDGREHPVQAGDLCVTRDGRSHSLKNNSEAPLRLLVVCCQLGGQTRSEEGR